MSHGSVATPLMDSGVWHYCWISLFAHILEHVSVKEFWKSDSIQQNYKLFISCFFIFHCSSVELLHVFSALIISEWWLTVDRWWLTRAAWVRTTFLWVTASLWLTAGNSFPFIHESRLRSFI